MAHGRTELKSLPFYMRRDTMALVLFNNGSNYYIQHARLSGSKNGIMDGYELVDAIFVEASCYALNHDF